jgi:hypothetical protein
MGVSWGSNSFSVIRPEFCLAQENSREIKHSAVSAGPILAGKKQAKIALPWTPSVLKLIEDSD